MNPDDTIAALSTAPGEAAIAVVRVSGPAALAVADRIFHGRGAPPSRRRGGTFVHGTVRDRRGRDVDDVLLLVMRAPRSFTGEDVVEIHGHGGAVAPRRVLRACLEAGCRSAEPGEFARRAFVNGKLDLVQAEGILDLIRARSERAASAAVEQMEGVLSEAFRRLSDLILSIAVALEAGLDFPEEELPPVALADQAEPLRAILQGLDRELAGWEEGRLLREGANVVLTGRPNVGKSTLFNALLGRNRAIVTPYPGTTRDTIEEGLILGGIPIRLIDTAGLREADCPVEREGVDRARREMPGADIVVHILDASEPPGSEDLRLWSAGAGRCRIVVLNKTDLGLTAERFVPEGVAYIGARLDRGDGLPEIRDAVRDLLCEGAGMGMAPHAVISERHRGILDQVRTDIVAAEELARNGSEDLTVPVVTRLRSALERMGELTGRVYQDDLLEGIFSRFCVGK